MRQPKSTRLHRCAVCGYSVANSTIRGSGRELNMPISPSFGRTGLSIVILLAASCSPKNDAVNAERSLADNTLPEFLQTLTIRNIYDQTVTLQNGSWAGPPFDPGGASRPRVTLLPEPTAEGDLDGDGTPETAILLTENSGGSGTFVYLALLRPHDGRAVNVDTLLLGDRVKVQSLLLENAIIQIDMLTHRLPSTDHATQAFYDLPRPSCLRRNLAQGMQQLFLAADIEAQATGAAVREVHNR